MKKKMWAKAAAIAAVSALMVAGSATMAQAVAPTLPATDAMYALNCNNNFPYSVGLVDPTTGALTGVGAQSDIQGDCFGQGAQDPVSGYVYNIDYSYGSQFLVKIDTVLGIRTVIGQFYDADNDQTVSPWSFAIDNEGAAFLFTNASVYSLDLNTAVVTWIADTGIGAYASAVDPTDDTLYAIEYDNNDGTQFYSINKTTGAKTSVGNYFTATGGLSLPTSLQFDSAGIAWTLDSDNSTTYQQIWSFDPSNFNGSGNLQSTLAYNSDNTQWWSESLLITRGAVTQPEAGVAPTETTLYSLNCDSENPFALTKVSTTDASGTGIGPAVYTSGMCYGQAAWDATTKTAYVTDWSYTNDALSRVNLQTGEITLINEFQDAANPGSQYDIDSIAIDSNGNAFAFYSGALYSLDLTNGAVTEVANGLAGYYYALAFNPADGKLYGVDYSTDYGVYEINTTTGAETKVGDSSGFPDQVESIQFTLDGQVYIECDDDTLWKATSAAAFASATKLGAFTVDATSAPWAGPADYEYYTESLLLVEMAPELPNTGTNGAALGVTGLGALMLISAGAALMLVRRRTA